MLGYIDKMLNEIYELIFGHQEMVEDEIEYNLNTILNNLNNMVDGNETELSLKSIIEGCGNCYGYATAKAREINDKKAKVIHGTVKSFVIQNRKLKHGWLVTKGRVFDWQSNDSTNKDMAIAHIKSALNSIPSWKKSFENKEKWAEKAVVNIYKKGWELETYQKVFKPKIHNVYNSIDAMILTLRTQSNRPWTKSEVSLYKKGEPVSKKNIKKLKATLG